MRMSQLTGGDHLARLFDHLVACVAVGHAHNFVFRYCQSTQFLGFRSREAQGFFAHHMQSGFERSFADSEVGAVRGGNGYGTDAIRTLCLRSEHRLVIGIAAIGVHADGSAKVSAALGVDIKSTRHQFEYSIAQCGRAVDVADLALATAPHHGPGDRDGNEVFSVDHLCFPAIGG